MILQVPNWHDCQQTTKGKRIWLRLDRSFHGNSKVRAVMRRQPDAIHCLHWIWCHADDNGTLDISEEHLADGLRDIFGASNRFDWQSRVNLLIAHKLLTVTQSDGNEFAIKTSPNGNGLTDKPLQGYNKEAVEPQHRDNPLSVEAQQSDNSPTVESLEPTETRTALRAEQLQSSLNREDTYNNHHKHSPHPPDTGGVCVAGFEVSELGKRGQAYATNQALELGWSPKFGWVGGWLTIFEGRLNRPEAAPHLETIWQAAVDAGLAKNAMSPEWYQKCFEGKVATWDPRMKVKPASPAKPWHERVAEADRVFCNLRPGCWKGSELEYIPGKVAGQRFGGFFRLPDGEEIEENMFSLSEVARNASA